MSTDYHNPWLYNSEPFHGSEKKYYGFVYLITDLATGKLYIGRKYFWQLRKTKGKTKRQRSESDWRDYYSSNDWINDQIKKGRAKETFKREILHLCKSKGETNFLEIEEQFKREVLRDPSYLNDQINGKWYKVNVMKYTH